MLKFLLHILLISIAKRYPKTFNLLHKCFKYFMTVLDYTFWFVLEFLARYSGATPAGWSWLYQYKYLCTLWQSGRWQIMKDQSEASISDIWPMRSSGWCGLVTSWQHQVWGAPLSRVATVAITKILKQDHSTSLIQKQYLHKTKIYNLEMFSFVFLRSCLKCLYIIYCLWHHVWWEILVYHPC